MSNPVNDNRSWWERGWDAIMGSTPFGTTAQAVTGKLPEQPEPPVYTDAYNRQMRELEDLGGRSTLDSILNKEMGRQQNEMLNLSEAPVDTTPTFEDFYGQIMGLAGGSGGGVNLSGFNAMLDDIASREARLGSRRDENLAGIQSLYESAAAAREEDKAALEASINAQIESDISRRAEQDAARRAADAERFETASEARAALGADVGTGDLVSETVEQSIGRLAERALAGQQDIGTTGELARQQLQAEQSGYTSAQELATRALTNAYEDRLAQLASERAAIQGQMAQAQASARSSGPSINEVLGLMGAYGDIYGGNEEAVELPGLAGIMQQYDSVYGNDPIATRIAANFPAIANAVYAVTPETGNLANPLQLAAAIVEANPQYRPYQSLILQLAQESGI